MKRTALLLLMLCLLSAIVVRAEELGGVAIADKAIMFDAARKLIIDPDLADIDNLTKAETIFRQLGTYSRSNEYLKYTELLRLLSTNELDLARGTLISSRAASSEKFLSDINETEGLYTLEELEGYLNARIAQRDNRIYLALTYYKAHTILDAADQVGVLFDTMPTAFADAQNDEINGFFDAALAKYQDLISSGYAEAQYASDALNGRLAMRNEAEVRIAEGNDEEALRILKELSDASFYGASSRFEEFKGVVYEHANELIAQGDYEKALYWYAVLGQYGYSDAAWLYEDIYAKYAPYRQGCEFEIDGNYTAALNAYSSALGFEPADTAKKTLEYRLYVLQESANAFQGGSYSSALSSYMQLRNEGFVGVEGPMNDALTQLYAIGVHVENNGDLQYARELYNLGAEYGHTPSADSAARLNSLFDELGVAQSYEAIGDYRNAYWAYRSMLERGIAEAVEGMNRNENALLDRANQYYYAGDDAGALVELTFLMEVGNESAYQMRNVILLTYREIMRKEELAGNLSEANELHEFIRQFSPDVEAVVPSQILFTDRETGEDLLFDSDYYLGRYEDLQKTGMNAERAREHWKTKGIREGRQGSPAFNAVEYAAMYPDVAAEYADDYKSMLQHYWIHGIAEGRNGTYVFNALDYMKLNPDMAEMCGYDICECVLHYIEQGYEEGRSAIIGDWPWNTL